MGKSRRLKVLYIADEALVALLSLDGTRRVRVEGMPADAKIVGYSSHLFFHRDALALKVQSETFPEVAPYDALPTLELKVTEADGADVPAVVEGRGEP